MDGSPLKRSSLPVLHYSCPERAEVNSSNLRLESLDDIVAAMEGVWRHLTAADGQDKHTQAPLKGKDDRLFRINELQGALDWLREHFYLDGQQLEYHESIAIDSVLPLLFSTTNTDGGEVYDGLVTFATFNRWYRLACEVVLAKRETAYDNQEDIEIASNQIREAILYSMRAEGMITEDHASLSGAYTGSDSISPHVSVYLSSQIPSGNNNPLHQTSRFSRRFAAPQSVYSQVDDTVGPPSKNLRFAQPEGSVLSGFVADVVCNEDEDEGEEKIAYSVTDNGAPLELQSYKDEADDNIN
jgi:hypothetical protein